MKDRIRPIWIGVYRYFGFDEMTSVLLSRNLQDQAAIAHTVITAHRPLFLNAQDVLQRRIQCGNEGTA